MIDWVTAFLNHPAVLVGLGGAVGANARYWIGAWFRAQPWAQEFTWGTLVINVLGSLVLGVVAIVWRDRSSAGFLLLGTGFCGGFTTFSTFSLEVTEAIQRGRWDLAGLYVGSSVLAGVLAFAGVAMIAKAGGP